MQACILIIDDEPIAREALAALLASDSYRLEFAESGAEGLARAAELRPDLILLDVMMPGMSGFEVCRKLRSHGSLAETPVVMITALDDHRSRIEGLDAGADDFLSKPFNRAELRARVQTIARLNRARKLLDEKSRFFSLADLLPHGMLLLNGDARIEYANPAMVGLLGFASAASLNDQNFLGLVAPEQIDYCRSLCRGVTQHAVAARDIETVLLRSDGTRVPTAIDAVQYPWRDASMILVVVRDITEHTLYLEQLQRQSQVDALTGLANRNLLFDRLSQSLIQARVNNGMVALLLLDIDRLKVINRSLGYDVGDELLQIVGRRLQEAAEVTATTARISGDEFAVLLPQPGSASDVTAWAQRLSTSISQPTELRGQTLRLSSSVGISVYPTDADTASSMLECARIAMLRSKQRVGDAIHFFNADTDSRMIGRLGLEIELRKALPAGQFKLYYQPKVAADTQQLLGAEALIRWHRPDDNMMAPGQFIPLAEESGLILELGAWVIDEACRQIDNWRASGYALTSVSVNVSPRQLSEQDLLAICRKNLELRGLPASCLGLEITESMALADPTRLAHKLRDLQGIGLELSLDDFGSGFSNLAYLSQLPLNFLKIDRSLISDLNEGTKNAVLLAAMIHMSRNLGFQTIAEGVETEQQAEFLRQQGCEQLQGYYFSRPLDAETFARLWLAI
ncbi:MAG: EAL domain-containing protein [Methylotetracoccus sp.]